MTDSFRQAQWITAQDYAGLEPLPVFHKELTPLEPAPAALHAPELRNYHMLVRGDLPVASLDADEPYILDITADDYYKLYINGHFVGQGPAPSNPSHYAYNRYDVGDYLRVGLNTVAVHVYYQGLINRVWTSGDYRQGLIAELRAGDEILLATDADWRYVRAEEFVTDGTYGYDTQFKEHIDSRLKRKGWREPAYDASSWLPVHVHPDPDYQLVLQDTPPVSVYKLAPAQVEWRGEGHVFVDMGQEITGQLTLQASGPSGSRVRLLCGEELWEDKRVRSELRCNCSYDETWTLSGGVDVLEHYDYKAFRYAEIIVEDGADVDLSGFAAIVRHYPLSSDVAELRSSDALLEGIWSICANAVKYGTQEAYLDCPSREKGQYLGDNTVTAPAHLYISGDLRIMKKSLRDFALSAAICPGLMAVAPGSHMQEIADYSLQWPYQLYTYYMHSGDRAFVAEMLPVAEGILAYFRRYRRSDGLLENVKEKWNLVDWPQNLRDNYDFDLSLPVGDGCHNVVNAFYCGAVKMVEVMREILGVSGPGDRFVDLAAAYRAAFFDPDRELFLDSTVSSHASLHSNVQALFWGLAPDRAVGSIVQLIRSKGLNCGVYNAYFLLKGLASVGEQALAYELLTSTGEHSWANMLREGATTAFEAWGKEQKWNTSLCHPWASAPISVLIEDIFGLRPAAPGWEQVAFDPHVPEELEFLAISFETVRGRIQLTHQFGQSHWEWV